MKNAILCIIAGFIFAVASCSAIKMTKSNIKVQKDTLPVTVYRPSLIPAVQIIEQPVRVRTGTRAFRDSLINGLITINQKVDKANKKLDSTKHAVDSILNRQTQAIQARRAIAETLFEMQGTISNLRLDTARLYKNSVVSKDVKDDAIVGNTLRSFVVNVLIFIAGGIILILILIVLFHRNLSNNIKRFKQHAT